MASYKDYKSISAAKKAGSIYYTNKAGKKMLAVTKEDLDSWKKKNKGFRTERNTTEPKCHLFGTRSLHRERNNVAYVDT